MEPAIHESQGASHRAVWVWNQPRPKALVRFAARNSVDTIFLQVPAKLSQSEALPWSRRVVRRAHRRGMRVLALNGDLGWLERPWKALEWQASAEATGLFDGIHIDVEPWTLEEWQSDPTPLIRKYLALLRQMNQETSLPLEADIAYWLHAHEAPDGTPLDQAVMAELDAVTVMSYRNRVRGPDGMTTVGQHALRTATQAGIPCRLAAETMDYGPSKAQTKQTFHSRGKRAMRRVLRRVDRIAGESPSYNGVAIHYYGSWRALRR